MMNNNVFKSSNLVLCAIYDKVACTYTPPMAFANEKTAGRYYLNLLGKNDNPTHFQLVRLGTYDNVLGVISDVGNNSIVIDGLTIVDDSYKIEVI